MLADRYKVHKVEFQHYHLASTETSYLKALRARLEKAKSRATQINLEFSGLNISAPQNRDRLLAIDLTKMWIDHAVTLGCEDGILVFRDGAFTKVASPDAYGRIGNQAGSPASPVVLGDYKTDPDADLERPETVALVDTRTAEIRLVDRQGRAVDEVKSYTALRQVALQPSPLALSP